MLRRSVFIVCLSAAAVSRADPPTLTNLGAKHARLRGDRVVYSRWETFAREDLNGDGDLGDIVLGIEDLGSRRVTNVGLLGVRGPDQDTLIGPFWENGHAFWISEAEEGRDLNGDGDRADLVMHVHDAARGETTNTGLAVLEFPGNRSTPYAQQSGRWLEFTVHELEQDGDLNGDGDTIDEVHHVHDLATGKTTALDLDIGQALIHESWLALQVFEAWSGKDLNGDGDHEDVVQHVHDLATGETRNLRLALASPAPLPPISGGRIAIEVWEGAQGGSDLDGDGNADDVVLHVHDLATRETRNIGLAGSFRRLYGSRAAVQVFESQARKDLNGDGDTTDPVLHVLDLSTGEIRNLGLAGDAAGPIANDCFFGCLPSSPPAPELFVLAVPEALEGRDLNGDGDLKDAIAHAYDFATGLTTNLELALSGNVTAVGRRFTFEVEEQEQGRDLNGDGDASDVVLHVHDTLSGKTLAFPFSSPTPLDLSGERLFLTVYEAREGADLNGDGDRQEGVLHAHDFSTETTRNLGVAASINGFLSSNQVLLAVSELGQGADLDGSGRIEDRNILHVADLLTGNLENLGLEGEGPVDSTGRLLVKVPERLRNEDLNGDGRLEDTVWHLARFAGSQGSPSFLRGDCDQDGAAAVGITDAVFLLSHAYLGGEAPRCLSACDHDGDGSIAGVTDAIFLLSHLFLGGPALPAPYPECGASPRETDAVLGCEEPVLCR